jgi:hypothetical protein
VAYFVYGSFCFVMVIYVWFFVPETKGMIKHFFLKFVAICLSMRTNIDFPIFRVVIGVHG